MFKVGINTLIAIPLSNGMAAQFTGTFATPIGNLAKLTVGFYAWTPGTLSFTGLSSRGLPLPNVVAMGSFDLTQKGGGTVTLVAPSKVTISPTLAQRRTVSFTTLVLTFVPEPGAVLLLGAGALALPFIGRARR